MRTPILFAASIFVTGHARMDGTPMHWPTLGAAAAQGLTLVIYMGVAAIDGIRAGLLDALPAHTPAALVQNASLPTQRHAICTLDTLVTTCVEARIGSPAIIVIGDVLRGLGGLRELPLPEPKGWPQPVPQAMAQDLAA